MAQSTRVEELLNALADESRAIVGVERVAVWLLDDDLRTYRLVASSPSGEGLGVGSFLDPVSFAAAGARNGFSPVVVDDAGDLPGPAGMRSVMAVPMVVQSRALGFLSFDNPGSVRQFSAADIQLASGVAAVAAVKLDQLRTERVLDNALAREQLLRALVQEIHEAPFSLRERLQRFAERACAALGAEHAALYVTAPDGRHVSDIITVNAAPAVRRALDGYLHTPIRASELGRRLMEGGNVTVGDVRSSPAYADAAAIGVRAFIAVPLHAMPVRLGALTLAYSSGPHAFTDEEIEFAEDLGRVGGLTIRSAYLYETALEREQLRGQMLRRVTEAQEMDRRLLATEVQDTLVQRQLLAGSLVELAQQSFARGDAAGGTRHLDRALSELDRAKQAARSVLRMLRRPDADLVPAIAELASELASDGVHVTVDGVIPAGTDPDIVTLLYRIAQEALSNVRRHAMASNVTVDVAYDHDYVRLVIADDGRGFQTSPLGELVRRGRYGIASIYERTSYTEGTAMVESEPGGGTRVTVALPLRPAVQKQEIPS